jgi:hypothetical protein
VHPGGVHRFLQVDRRAERVVAGFEPHALLA